jgi:hypothetical protein
MRTRSASVCRFGRSGQDIFLISDIHRISNIHRQNGMTGGDSAIQDAGRAQSSGGVPVALGILGVTCAPATASKTGYSGSSISATIQASRRTVKSGARSAHASNGEQISHKLN